MQATRSTSLAFPLSLVLATALAAGCSSSDKNDGGTGGDAGVDSGLPADSGVHPDAEVPDTGPLPCLFDQGGRENRGCDPGEVCNLAMSPAQCVPGKACTADTDCNVCSDLRNPQDCGHGFNLVAVCDTRHGNVCTRSRAPCEPCTEDRDCGRPHPILPVTTPNACLDYGGGQKFCGRACGNCPDGFSCDPTTSQCKRESCDPLPTVCPADNMSGPTCAGTDQICPGEECPGTGGAKCSTNDQPGALGTCIGFCTTNADCPANLPVCNERNGLCIAGCTKGSCAGNQVCHSDGFCRAPCEDDGYCTENYGEGTYCNTPGRPPPRIYKPYRDDNSCAPLGCEDKVDCAVAGRVCDKSIAIPECVDGCYESDDCSSGFVCKSTGGAQPRPSYSRAECRALPVKTDMAELGVCCNPGCTDRNLQCGINEFCCGEVGSPFEDPASCLTVTSTGGPRAEPGVCFEMPAPDPWCHICMANGDCNSGYTRGYNVDPNINGGQPFQEQEWCRAIADGLAICNVTCNPANIDDNQCPRGWNCRAFQLPCLQDADCNGLECINEDTSDPMNPRPGQCKCGEGGIATAACPTAYATVDGAVTYPRCVDVRSTGGDMTCVASYNCEPAGLRVDMMTGDTNYPAMCGF
ncbi:hypothetical protein L6R52_29030 [Myxococcota bacterium]|nr:hypothetical protein [Myxococcota bacterium]